MFASRRGLVPVTLLVCFLAAPCAFAQAPASAGPPDGATAARGADGAVTHLILHQGGRDQKAVKVR